MSSINDGYDLITNQAFPTNCCVAEPRVDHARFPNVTFHFILSGERSKAQVQRTGMDWTHRRKHPTSQCAAHVPLLMTGMMRENPFITRQWRLLRRLTDSMLFPRKPTPRFVAQKKASEILIIAAEISWLHVLRLQLQHNLPALHRSRCSFACFTSNN